ncbi:MAG: cytochrome c1 [Alphaproteobacteria bacterium]|nr:cytochrome c1 [Alphaproteobacteria bacterium]
MYDKAELQRGFQVYKEVCSACHSLNRVKFYTLADEGGPGFTPAEAKAIAAGYQIEAEPNDKGELFDANGERLKRPGILADHFPAPFPNEQAARAANGGAAPPDLSLIAKAREDGPNYIHSLLTGFGQPVPAGYKLPEGKYYNPYFPGRAISMPPPLTEGAVTYADGTKATVDQMSTDVTNFLMWAAEPKLEERHRLGFGVMAFLLVLAGLCYLSYRRVWKDTAH